MNRYNNYDIRHGAFPRKVKPVTVQSYKAFEPRPNGSGHTLTRDQIVDKRHERQTRSRKQLAKPSRGVPALDPVR